MLNIVQVYPTDQIGQIAFIVQQLDRLQNAGWIKPYRTVEGVQYNTRNDTPDHLEMGEWIKPIALSNDLRLQVIKMFGINLHDLESSE